MVVGKERGCFETTICKRKERGSAATEGAKVALTTVLLGELAVLGAAPK